MLNMLKKFLNLKLILTALVISTSSLSQANPYLEPQPQTRKDIFLQKINEIKNSTTTYWQPHLNRADEYWTDKFNNTYHPFLIRNYNSYYQTYGTQVSAYVFALHDFLTPALTKQYNSTLDFWYNQNPEMFDDLANVPTPIKKNYEKLIFTSWKMLNENPEKLEQLSEQVKSAVSFTQLLLAARNEPRDPKIKTQLARLQKILEELRPYNLDPEMSACYEVHIIDIPMVNSFNTGCNIFVTTPVTELLNDDDMRATLAHEISHGDQGHSVKTLAEMSKQAGIHLAFLIMDEIDWLVTGRLSDRVKQVIKEGNAPIIFQAFGEQAPLVEINADFGGATILKRSGHSPHDLINALIKLTDASILERQDSESKKQESIRKYPALEKRIEEIKSKFSL